jgi:hypothetical protein
MYDNLMIGSPMQIQPEVWQKNMQVSASQNVENNHIYTSFTGCPSYWSF